MFARPGEEEEEEEEEQPMYTERLTEKQQNEYAAAQACYQQSYGRITLQRQPHTERGEAVSTLPQAGEVWEKYCQPRTNRIWFFRPDTADYFFASDPNSGWDKYENATGRVVWVNDNTGRFFFEPTNAPVIKRSIAVRANH